MASARTVKASSAHEVAMPRNEVRVRASEIPVVLSPESLKIFGCAGSPARSPERRHLSRPGA